MISPAIAVECAIRKPVASPVIPAIPDLQDRSENTAQHLSPHSHNLHKSHRGYSDHVDLNDRPRLRVAACRRSLIDMNYITSFTGMTDKWFYKLISEGHFPKPIKLGRSSRWYKSEVEQWMQQRIEESRGAAA